MMKRIFIVAVVGLARTVAAQAPTLSVAPADPAPGSLVRITFAAVPADSGASISGTMAGEPLHFVPLDSGRYGAIGPIPADANDSVMARVFIDRGVSRDTVLLAIAVPTKPPPARESSLAVDQRFTRPMDAATQARIARENRLAASVGRKAHDRPPMWTEPFLRPRESRVTSQFGTGRMFNGTVASRHLGVDYQGAPGAPVLAANRGIVALVDTFFLAGRLVYIDHGGGVVTGYFHLTSPLVQKGDTVERGQRIGTVGATGRVTGPHLHWAARYGAVTVNPGDLLELPVEFYARRERE